MRAMKISGYRTLWTGIILVSSVYLLDSSAHSSPEIPERNKIAITPECAAIYGIMVDFFDNNTSDDNQSMYDELHEEYKSLYEYTESIFFDNFDGSEEEAIAIIQSNVDGFSEMHRRGYDDFVPTFLERCNVIFSGKNRKAD